jgi:hypothetical protein
MLKRPAKAAIHILLTKNNKTGCILASKNLEKKNTQRLKLELKGQGLNKFVNPCTLASRL